MLPREGDIAGADDWRYGQLRAAVAAHDPRAHLDALFGTSDDAFRGDSAPRLALHEGMARATCPFLHEQGQLWPLYRAWRDRGSTSRRNVAGAGIGSSTVPE